MTGTVPFTTPPKRVAMPPLRMTIPSFPFPISSRPLSKARFHSSVSLLGKGRRASGGGGSILPFSKPDSGEREPSIHLRLRPSKTAGSKP